ncbi:hypothetical protein [Billgrantia aerodenitrificans]|jgi:hypothetical protein|uniref:Uncharacterized protein n=1 Tax=Billgrantia aerodenitrificans TaxID=2733483 RepID=A0ABS9AQ22_9GAMM|nr:hypothetical protein [Halomonas aerodenitrificans]MCE8023938.1 hypothetical protein [Halomonas aerodenitrificans]
MTLERAYILLAVFYSALVAIGAIALLVGGGPVWGVAILLLGALVAAGLWGQTLGKPVMNPRMWRPLAGILVVGFVLQLFAVFSLSLSGAELTWLLTGAIFSVLPAIMLFQYGKRDQEVWATPEECEGGKMLRELLARQRELVLEKQEADRQATVKLTKEGDTYRASVTRGNGAEVERFEERFACPATLAFFVIKYTCISVNDIAAQYAEERALTT